MSLHRRLLFSGTLLVASAVLLAVTQARLGSPLFFLITALMAACPVILLLGAWHAQAERRLVLAAIGLALAARLPLAIGPVNYDSDMIRYVWDGRVQRFGYNPYALVPSDPALAHTHTADTVRMPSRHDRTPYPPVAQLFFRGMVTLWESARVMKVVLTIFDIATIFVLWRWLRATGRNEWLVLTYAWNPLVILEAAHSGHIDALGTFWIALSAYWLTARRTALASVAYVLAVATKLLPIVLAPLFIGRVKWRDIVLGGALMAALYAPFMTGTDVPVGAVPTVVAHIRFNSAIFRPLAWFVTPNAAAAFALLIGVGAALWARWKLDADDPAAWAWPMALALACAPVIYPWYLVYFTPFLFTRATLPLAVWTYTVIPVYLVWHWAQFGARWRVPTWLMVVEYALVVGAACYVALAARRRADRPATSLVSPSA